MQTLAQFVAHWTNRYCDYDGYFGGQCVDLADFYMRDVWGIPPFFVTGAVDLYGHRPDLIEWIANDAGNPNQFPRPGDMVIWHLDAQVGTGINGHVDIFLSGGGLKFTGLDENWPIGSKPHPQLHNYQGVRGWGRRRHALPAPPPAPAPGPPPSPPGPLPGPVPHPPPVSPPVPLPPGPSQPPTTTPPFDWLAWLKRILGIA